MKRGTLLACCILVLAQPADARLGTWREYSSAHFTVYSDARRKQAIELISALERFRDLTVRITNVPDSDKRNLIIFLYSRPADFNKIDPTNFISGLYHSTDFGPRILVGPGSLKRRMSSLYHEFVHHQLRTQPLQHYPLWYDEGVAEMLAGSEFDDATVLVGAIPKSRATDLGQFGPLGVLALLRPNPRRNPALYWLRFYATSWLFVHYLQISPFATQSTLREQTRDYLRRYNEGETPLDAFAATYGMSPAEMDEALKRYATQKRITVLRLPSAPFTGTVRERELTPAEAVCYLAENAWDLQLKEVALEYARQVDPSTADPADARTLSLRAVLEDGEGTSALADQLRDRALSLAPGDARVLSNTALLEWDRFIRSARQSHRDMSLLEAAAHHAALATEVEPNNVEAYRIQWLAQIEQQQPLEAAKSMMAAYRADPGNAALNLEIGNFLYDRDEFSLARPFIERAWQWTHDQYEQARLQRMLDWIDRTEAESNQIPPAPNHRRQT